MNTKYLVIGDLHLKPLMPYGEYIPDGRKEEKNKVFTALREAAKGCSGIVLLGDQLNSRHNQSEVIREFTELVESFGNKEIYVMAGNHEKLGDGKSAIDYLDEVNKPNWHIITKAVTQIGDLTFLPYFYKGELEVKSNEEAKKQIMKTLPKVGRILFTHMTVSGMRLGGILTDQLPEVVLDKKDLEKRFQLVVNGHIHEPSAEGNTINVGSTFTMQTGDLIRRAVIIKLTPENITWESIELPVMPIIKLENPTPTTIRNMGNMFVKAVFTKKLTPTAMKVIRTNLNTETLHHIILEQYITKRDIIPFDETQELSIDNLLKIYAGQREVDLNRLIAGYELIKS